MNFKSKSAPTVGRERELFIQQGYKIRSPQISGGHSSFRGRDNHILDRGEHIQSIDFKSKSAPTVGRERELFIQQGYKIRSPQISGGYSSFRGRDNNILGRGERIQSIDFKSKSAHTAGRERELLTPKGQQFRTSKISSDNNGFRNGVNSVAKPTDSVQGVAFKTRSANKAGKGVLSTPINELSRLYNLNKLSSGRLTNSSKNFKISEKSRHIRFKTKGISNINTIKNIGLFQSKKIAAFSARSGYKISKRGLAALLSTLAKDSENNRTAVSEAKKLWTDSYMIRNFASKYSIKGVGFARYNLEKRYLNNAVKPINRRAAFSPLKSRRRAFNKKTALQQKQIAKMLSKKAKNKIVGSLGINTSGRMFSRLKEASKVFGAAGKALGMVVSTIGTVFKILSVVILPLIFVVTIISIASVALSGSFDTADLDILTGTAIISNNKIDVEINKDDDTGLISFQTELKKNQFSYKQRTIRITGSIKKAKITVKGKMADKEIALEGVMKNGKADLVGFMGDKAIRALSGSMFGSGKTTKLGKRIVAVTKKYDNPYSTYPGMCLAWVYDVYREAGVKQNVHGCCASKTRELYAVKKGAIPVGALVFSSPSYRSRVVCSCGRNAGHVGIYIGNNKIIGSQVPAVWTLDQWNKICGYGGYYMPKE